MCKMHENNCKQCLLQNTNSDNGSVVLPYARRNTRKNYQKLDTYLGRPSKHVRSNGSHCDAKNGVSQHKEEYPNAELDEMDGVGGAEAGLPTEIAVLSSDPGHRVPETVVARHQAKLLTHTTALDDGSVSDTR